MGYTKLHIEPIKLQFSFVYYRNLIYQTHLHIGLVVMPHEWKLNSFKISLPYILQNLKRKKLALHPISNISKKTAF
jgi:hypothetical protein